MNLSPHVALAYTSVRPASVLPVMLLWAQRAGAHAVNISFTLAADASDTATLAAMEHAKAQFPAGQVTVVKNNGERTCVAGWNEAARNVPDEADIIIGVADDFSPPLDWYVNLTSGLTGNAWWEGDKAVWVYDGYNADLMTLAILSRKRYDRFGYLFYPGYESMYADTEYTYAALADGVVIDARGAGAPLLFEHLHPDCGKRARDGADLKHSSSARYTRGKTLFEYRQGLGFPIDAGPVADQESTEMYQHITYALYVQCIRDDLCLAEVVKRVLDEALRDGEAGDFNVGCVYLCMPDRYWSGEPQRDSDKAEVEAACAEILETADAALLDVITLVQGVQKHSGGGKTRIQVETCVRNDALREIRRDGYHHILIVDGDELWRRGLLADLTAFIRDARPNSAYTGMVPSVGLPGLAVDGAKDKATIYIGRDATFAECRGAIRYRHELPGNRVIHFTATRRTMEEIIAKHRDSGHADDPDYDMEGWIREVLPNLHEGMADSHMYKRGQPGKNIWPVLRRWTAEELADIPDSVKRYLKR